VNKSGKHSNDRATISDKNVSKYRPLDVSDLDWLASKTLKKVFKYKSLVCKYGARFFCQLDNFSNDKKY